MGVSTIFYYIMGLFLLYIVGIILVWPIKKIIKLIWNGVLGGITLLLFNFIGNYFGLSIVINPLNAIIVGFLGVPGVILLLVLQMMI
ncbi:pro-sigmaK processing inhibitor BofA family protein [Tissierella praeacuta]|uniref:Inhibitor of the pro-sigma K processing machinery n=1 Tax=Tissierella praeacuta DSM 18095 TaxID=1123404 RepID=A0A1M4VHQ1_9FIRM|nr:pro-sigmaK processing inhibitor BofA family protein [Tissierella praeacuta]HAE92285.1 pro-sigmaK processing inhibitor BofA [Tissierella sp.]MBU5255460.1 pro-sigmaK processing inhibitor BofA family protein [Tissierella praeacuta]TCU79237.1 inhibitor of the pro-sigma K processing machinery [Tissierella praeacuta]SHE68420.1 inhibitor of the pro-sigma K processing machinery [Tissierella praeacuta DSM 18095]SUO99137.1 pro-sigmaK processing inhibitor BofA [Tissierella praeacuta]